MAVGAPAEASGTGGGEPDGISDNDNATSAVVAAGFLAPALRGEMGGGVELAPTAAAGAVAGRLVAVADSARSSFEVDSGEPSTA